MFAHKKRPIPLLLLAALILAICLTALRATLGVTLAAQAAPVRQIPIYTPTPGPDGRIIYIVKPNDTLLGISLLTGVSLEQLRAQNNLTTDTIVEGQKLLLGLGGPAEVTPTSGPSPTPTAVLPTPTPKPGQGTLCLILFNDLNGDSIRQSDEPSLPNGAISFGNQSGTVSKTVDSSSGTKYQCFKELPEGNYTISVAVPEGNNPTTGNTYEITLKPGDETYVNFGAQANSQTQAQPELPPAEGRRSPILGIIGILFLLAGVILAVFAARALSGR